MDAVGVSTLPEFLYKCGPDFCTRQAISDSMSDPFKGNSNHQLVREAQIGLTVLGLVLCLFAYIAYYRISGYQSRIPQHVIDAPIASSIPPKLQPSDLTTNQTSPRPPQKAPRRQHVLEPPDPSDHRRAASADERQNHDPTQEASRSDTIGGSEPIPPLDVNELRASTKAPFGVSKAPKSQSAAPVPPRDSDFEPHPQLALNKTAELPPAEIDTESRNAGVVADSTIPFQPQRLRVISRDQSEFCVEPTNSRSAELGPLSANAAGAEKTTLLGSWANGGQADDRCQDRQPQRAISQARPKNRTENSSKFPVAVEPEVVSPATQTSFVDDESPAKSPSDLEIPIQSEQSEDFVYRANDGDSFFSIAQDQYGDGRYFRALFEYNRDLIGECQDVKRGTRIRIPPVESLIKRWPGLCPPADPASSSPKSYTTRAGDTLFGIARQELGQASRYLELMEINRVRLPNDIGHLTPLSPGIRLTMPDQ